MQVKVTNQSSTKVSLSVVAKPEELQPIKEMVIKALGTRVKVSGFREGKAPVAVLEKNIDPAQLQQTFLEEAINQIYPQVIQNEDLRPVARPEIQIKKFVPFTTLEFDVEVAVIGDMKLADYKKITLKKTEGKVTEKDVKEVIENLQTRMSEKKDVERTAKDGDQVWIDFEGTDKDGKPIKGADGKEYPLVLGSKTFIPGFEEQLIGTKAGEEKTFTLTFPKDYGVKALAGQKVTFKTKITKVQEVIKPKADDAFAAQTGPFKTMDELKADIKKQLLQEKQQQANLQYESDLVKKVSDKTTVTIPKELIDDTVDRLVNEQKQNLTYRGVTYQEFLEQEELSEEKYRESLAPQAEERVKASLVLSEIAEKENLDVSPEELEIRVQVLKGQYKDQAMQADLEKPEVRRDIAMRMLSEKTVAKLAEYAQK